MHILKIIVCTMILGLLGACATLSKSECAVADWKLIGYEDGVSGKKETRLALHRKACAKHGVTPSQEMYKRGHQEGLNLYCVYDKGLRAGNNGGVAEAICSSNSTYHLGYKKGLASYCRYEKGLAHGDNGLSTRAVCSGSAVYQLGYEKGLALFCTYEKGTEDGGEGRVQYGLCNTNDNYSEGYDRGLESYCSYGNGYSLGVLNETYQSVCPTALNTDFLEGYDRGSQVNELRTEEEQLIDELDSVIDRQVGNEEVIRDIKGRLNYDRSLTAQQKNKLWERLEYHRSLRREANSEQYSIENKLDEVRLELSNLEIPES